MKRFTICCVLLMTVAYAAGQAGTLDTSFTHQVMRSPTSGNGTFTMKRSYAIHGKLYLAGGEDVVGKVNLLAPPVGYDQQRYSGFQLQNRANSYRAKPPFARQLFEGFVLPNVIEELKMRRQFGRW